MSAKILHEEFATNTALAGKADKVEVVDVEQTYTLEVTATAAYVANKSTVDGYIRSFSSDRGEPLIEALELSVSKGYTPSNCTLPMGVKTALDDFFAQQSQASDFFTYTATLDPVTLQPNRDYQIDNLVAFPETGDERDHMNTDNVVIALDTSDTSTELKIYCFTFTAETSACQVALPVSVRLGNEYEWVFAPGRKFEVSIKNNIALVAYVDTQTTNS